MSSKNSLVAQNILATAPKIQVDFSLTDEAKAYVESFKKIPRYEFLI
jgi:hypothetical protein